MTIESAEAAASAGQAFFLAKDFERAAQEFERAMHEFKDAATFYEQVGEPNLAGRMRALAEDARDKAHDAQRAALRAAAWQVATSTHQDRRRHEPPVQQNILKP
jgi:hypothetical protein